MKWFAFVALLLALVAVGPGVGWGLLAAGGWCAYGCGEARRA